MANVRDESTILFWSEKLMEFVLLDSLSLGCLTLPSSSLLEFLDHSCMVLPNHKTTF